MKGKTIVKDLYIIRRPILVSSYNFGKSVTFPFKTIIPIDDQMRAQESKPISHTRSAQKA